MTRPPGRTHDRHRARPGARAARSRIGDGRARDRRGTKHRRRPPVVHRPLARNGRMVRRRLRADFRHAVGPAHGGLQRAGGRRRAPRRGVGNIQGRSRGRLLLAARARAFDRGTVHGDLRHPRVLLQGLEQHRRRGCDCVGAAGAAGSRDAQSAASHDVDALRLHGVGDRGALHPVGRARPQFTIAALARTGAARLRDRVAARGREALRADPYRGPVDRRGLAGVVAAGHDRAHRRPRRGDAHLVPARYPELGHGRSRARELAFALAASLGALGPGRARRGLRVGQSRPHGCLRGGGAAARVALLLRDGHDAPDQVVDDARAGRGAAGRGAFPEARATAMNITRALILLGAAVVLAAINVSIMGKESIRHNGEIVYLDLAPRDPRSLMQGDYMALRFRLAQEIEASLHSGAPVNPVLSEGQTGFANIALDEKRVASLAKPGAASNLRIRYRLRKGAVWLGTNAFFFEEGTDSRYASARYGEFRLDAASGEAVLVGLRDAKFGALN